MTKHQPIAVSLGVLMLGPGVADVLATPPACATIEASNWHDDTGTWGLHQDSNGNIEGLLVSDASSTCPGGEYSVTGDYTGDGQFSLTAEWAIGIRPQGCAKTINQSGSIHQPGCNTASGTWTNSGGLNGQFEMSYGCRVPTGETAPQFQNWGSPGAYPTSAVFSQKLKETDFNWGGRKVTETFPVAGSDGCWFPGSLYSAVTASPSRTIYPSPDVPTSYFDAIGVAPEFIEYYRQKGRAPCGYELNQHLSTDCPAPEGDSEYLNHQVFFGIGLTTITSSRAGVQASKVWGTPAVQILLISVLSPVVLQ